MNACVLKETLAGEQRVALVPESVAKMTKKGFHVTWKPAPAGAGFDDTAYATAGAATTAARVQALAEADLVLKINPPHPQRWTR